MHPQSLEPPEPKGAGAGDQRPSEMYSEGCMAKLIVSGVAAVLVTALLTPAPAGAFWTNDKLAYLTFSGPVQVPGATLNAGTYRFRLTNPDTSRNVLQVLSNDGAIVYAMFHTIPDSRTKLTWEPTVTFKETPAGVAPAVHAIFYDGEYRGYEFVYGKGEPNMIPPVYPQPEITYSAAPEPIAEPLPEPVAEPAVEPAVEPAPEPLPVEELPRTASPLPLLALAGLTSLLAGLALRRS